MHIAQSIKRAPRWAWWTVGGVGAGGIAIKLYQGRAKSEDTQAASDATIDPATGLAYPQSPVPVIVPPVITGSGDNPEPGLGSLSEQYLGGISEVLGSWHDIVGYLGTRDDTILGHTTTRNDLIEGTLSQLALAGSAPQPAAANPSPVSATMAATAKKMGLKGIGGGYYYGHGSYYQWRGGKMVKVAAQMQWEAKRLGLTGVGHGYFKKGKVCYKWSGGKMKVTRCPKVAKPKPKAKAGR